MTPRAAIYPALILLVAAGIYFATRPETPAPRPAPATAAATGQDALAEVAVPATLSTRTAMGKTAFDANCAACHGTNAAGREGKGPPLVHPYYRPGHHGDVAFMMAARQGVRAHHWRFGDMPPVPGLTDADIANIVAYVRELQRENGIE